MGGDESDRLREYVEALQEQVTHLKISAYEAREESSAQVKARIEQAKADAAADQVAAATNRAGRRRAHGQLAVDEGRCRDKMRPLQNRMDREATSSTPRCAEDDAEGAEEDALDALGYARWAVEQAELAVLDAIDARASADDGGSVTDELIGATAPQRAYGCGCHPRRGQLGPASVRSPYSLLA